MSFSNICYNTCLYNKYIHINSIYYKNNEKYLPQIVSEYKNLVSKSIVKNAIEQQKRIYIISSSPNKLSKFTHYIISQYNIIDNYHPYLHMQYLTEAFTSTNHNIPVLKNEVVIDKSSTFKFINNTNDNKIFMVGISDERFIDKFEPSLLINLDKKEVKENKPEKKR
ncbi:hypothetical protein BDAP_001728 [Binucleata daphniae]